MLKKALSLVLTGLLINAVAVNSSYARSQDEQARNIEKVKENVRKLGVGAEARVEVKLHDGQRIAEQERVVTVVESKLKLVKVAVEMLDGNLMVGTNYRTLEEAPNILQRVGMNNAAHILFLKVTHCCMKRVFICYTLIARPFVCDNQIRFFGKLCSNESVKNFFGWLLAAYLQ